ncbi:MAG TPA: DJ-1/PfpI family protein [Candidatus Dependentiae bacterium]|nr:DJ-1/PfpI family protein [Candidatus Dependentiae bacterium]HRQ62816.1 DJ-1/PfpI family protein [Candidatus Dependentiae bacterium]
MNKKVLLVIAHEGFHPVEYGDTKKILEQAGYQVVTASNKDGYATDKDGNQVQVDTLLTQTDPKFYEGIYFIGGPGCLEHLDNATSYEFLKLTELNLIPYGAICAAVRILAHAEVLDGKMATGWNEDGKLPDILEDYGAQYVPMNVVVESHVVTAIGPKQAKDFGEKIVEVLDAYEKGL